MLFKYGKVVTGEFFYDRKEMQKKVLSFVQSGQSFMLKAPRRYGKTSLVKHVMGSSDIEYFYIDFRKTPRLELFNDMLMDFIYSNMGIKGALAQIKDNAIAFIRNHKTTIKVDFSIFEASVEFYADKKISQEDRMVRALDLAQSVAKSLNKKLYVFMDEFQDVKKLSSDFDILELMRGAMQHHDDVCYIFAGSHMTIMTAVFENKKSPFYNFCRKLKLEAFDKEELSSELQASFKTRSLAFESDELLYGLLDRLKGHPANTMLVMLIIESMAIEKQVLVIKQELIEDAYTEAMEEMGDLIAEYLKEIKTKEHLHDVIYRMANGEDQVLESSSLLQKKKYLVDMGYLLQVGRGDYKIIDGFLEEDLKNYNI